MMRPAASACWVAADKFACERAEDATSSCVVPSASGLHMQLQCFLVVVTLEIIDLLDVTTMKVEPSTAFCLEWYC